MNNTALSAGLLNDIKWFEGILRRQSKAAVTEFSELYRNKGTNRYYRAYAEVKKSMPAKSKIKRRNKNHV